MLIDFGDQRREVIAFYDQVIRHLDARLARIERNKANTYWHLPAWQHIRRRREQMLRLQAEA
jgi:hypothetical protein